MPRPDQAQAERFFDLLANPVAEIRCIPRTTKDRDVESGLFRDSREFADAACGLTARGETEQFFQGVFSTINRLKPADELIGLSVNGIVANGLACRHYHMQRIRVLPLDCDPTRDHPDGGKICTTDAEHVEGLRMAAAAVEIGKRLGWPEPAVIDSGNGAYVLWGVDLPNSAASRALIKGVLLAFKDQLDSDKGHIDDSVDDPSRVLRIPGTINRKSPHTEDRPNRLVQFLSAPDRLAVVTEEQLKAFASTYIPPIKQHRQRPAIPLEVYEERVQAVINWVKQHATIVGVQKKSNPDDGAFTVITVQHCPIKNDKLHNDGGPGFLIYANGNITFKCFHGKCPEKKLPDVESVWKSKLADAIGGMATYEIFGVADRYYHDPLGLAESHLAQWKHDGVYTLASFLGDTWRFDLEHGWLPITKKDELHPWIRDTVQDVFDHHAEVVSRISRQRVKPTPVKPEHVSNTYAAMQSVCRRDVPPIAQAPFWLEPSDWAAEDLLVFRNGILNVRHYIEGKTNHLRPLTPKLFYEHQAKFDFIPSAPEPVEWNRFLKSLDREPEWYKFLQEIMGYCLWQSFNLQKFFVYVGPTRCGKGTINHVIENLAGGKSACAALTLKAFVDQFGMEDAIAKRVAFVPEIEMPKKDVHQIVANLKAITGGDLVQVCRKQIKNLSLRLAIKIIMSTNQFVPLPDNSGALQTRMLPLRFTKSFKGEEDTELGNKLAAEYPGILIWALEGLRRLWATKSFTLPESTKQELQQLTDESQPLKAFIDECCDLDTSKYCQTVAMYKVYEDWHNKTQEGKPLADNSFVDAMRATLPTVRKERISKPLEGKKYFFIETAHDKKVAKPNVWIGIVPKPEWCRRSEFHHGG